MARRHAGAAARNAGAILARLREVLPRSGTVLELGSGTGEHAVLFARELPGLVWQPSDPDEASRESIAAWTAIGGVRNVERPLDLDLLAPAWRLRRADAIVVVNVLHVAPRPAAEALVAGAAAVLPGGGPLVVAGPFRRSTGAGPPVLAAADRCVPVLDDLVGRARAHDLVLEETTPIPDECLLVVLRRAAAGGGASR